MTNSSSHLMTNDDFCLDVSEDLQPTPPSSSSYSSLADNGNFLQHDDPDVVIPDHLCWPLLFSSHLLLGTAILAALYSYWVLFGVNVFVYITSILHWRAPRFSTIERKLDYIAVITNIIYGTIFALSCRTLTYKIIWFAGLFVIGVFFISNETTFYVQVMKNPLGSDIHEKVIERDSEKACCPATKPNTEEREWVYTRTVWIHLLCVHVLGNALAMIIITGKHDGY